MGRRDHSEAALERRATPVGYVGYAFRAVSRPPTCQHLRRPVNLLRVVRHGILLAVSHLLVCPILRGSCVVAVVTTKGREDTGPLLLPKGLLYITGPKGAETWNVPRNVPIYVYFCKTQQLATPNHTKHTHTARPGLLTPSRLHLPEPPSVGRLRPVVTRGHPRVTQTSPRSQRLHLDSTSTPRRSQRLHLPESNPPTPTTWCHRLSRRDLTH